MKVENIEIEDEEIQKFIIASKKILKKSRLLLDDNDPEFLEKVVSI